MLCGLFQQQTVSLPGHLSAWTPTDLQPHIYRHLIKHKSAKNQRDVSKHVREKLYWFSEKWIHFTLITALCLSLRDILTQKKSYSELQWMNSHLQKMPEWGNFYQRDISEAQRGSCLTIAVRVRLTEESPPAGAPAGVNHGPQELSTAELHRFHLRSHLTHVHCCTQQQRQHQQDTHTGHLSAGTLLLDLSVAVCLWLFCPRWSLLESAPPRTAVADPLLASLPCYIPSTVLACQCRASPHLLSLSLAPWAHPIHAHRQSFLWQSSHFMFPVVSTITIFNPLRERKRRPSAFYNPQLTITLEECILLSLSVIRGFEMVIAQTRTTLHG